MHFKGRCLSSFVLLLFAVVTVFAQERRENVFEKVQLELRPRLIERLKEYVTYERTRQYEKLYQLLYDPNDKNGDKEVYSKSRMEAEGRRGVIQEFTPTSILDSTLQEGDVPIISLMGRAKVFLKGRTVKKEMTIEARFHEGEWYFSELLEFYLHID